MTRFSPQVFRSPNRALPPAAGEGRKLRDRPSEPLRLVCATRECELVSAFTELRCLGEPGKKVQPFASTTGPCLDESWRAGFRMNTVVAQVDLDSPVLPAPLGAEMASAVCQVLYLLFRSEKFGCTVSPCGSKSRNMASTCTFHSPAAVLYQAALSAVAK